MFVRVGADIVAAGSKTFDRFRELRIAVEASCKKERRFHSALRERIGEKIKRYEGTDPNGLNGFILLSHVGAGPKRIDKFYEKLDSLILWLRSKNYEMVRLDELLTQK